MSQSTIEINTPEALACLIYDLESKNGDLQAVISEWKETTESNII